MDELAGKVAVVTGAASGIGLAVARRLANEQMKVVLADIEGPALGAAADSLAEHGDRILAIETDVSDYSSVDAMASRVADRVGNVHILCNNAGVAIGGVTWKLTIDDWNWCLGVNLMGVVHGIRRFVPAMIEHGEPGHIVNVASMAGLFASPMNAAYGVAKHAVVALSETLYHDLTLSGTKLRVSCVCPGWVRTNIVDAHRNRPDELADSVEATEQEQSMLQMFRGAIESGMDPANVADQIVTAVAAGTFWVYTHPEYLPVSESRCKRMLAGENPLFDPSLLMPKN